MISPREDNSGKHYTELIVYQNSAHQFYLTGLSGSQQQHKTLEKTTQNTNPQHCKSKTSCIYFNELPSHLQNIYEENKPKKPNKKQIHHI